MAEKHFHKSAWDNPLDYIFKTAKDAVLGWGPGRKMMEGLLKKKKKKKPRQRPRKFARGREHVRKMAEG